MQDIDRMRIVEIEDVIDESPTIRTLIFNDKITANAKAGQFIMVWLPSIDELPMSVMIPYKYDEKLYAAISVRKRGISSTYLYSRKKGDKIGVRGPYGRAFEIKSERSLLVGGGTGLVPLIRLAKQSRCHTLIMGARSKDEVIFEQLARSMVDRVIVTTDDGSYGLKGFATDPLEELLKEERFDIIYTCGPEKMMKRVLEIANRYGIEAEASLERIMKCGIGLCSSCALDKYILCKDGPVMKGSIILGLEEFGKCYRDKSGQLKSTI
ncbi:MAG: dihydroorotate dehydrogenase electron transfer subunit [Candidatus Nitrosocaldaceae archaeon]